MQIQLTEQEVVDACAQFTASQHGRRAEDVRIDLSFSPSAGFSATADLGGWRNLFLGEQELVDAIAIYCGELNRVNPARLEVDLQYNEDDGVHAEVISVDGLNARW